MSFRKRYDQHTPYQREELPTEARLPPACRQASRRRDSRRPSFRGASARSSRRGWRHRVPRLELKVREPTNESGVGRPYYTERVRQFREPRASPFEGLGREPELVDVPPGREWPPVGEGAQHVGGEHGAVDAPRMSGLKFHLPGTKIPPLQYETAHISAPVRRTIVPLQPPNQVSSNIGTGEARLRATA